MSAPFQNALTSRVAEIRDRIAASEARSGRVAGSVTLLAATKTVSEDLIREAVAAGVEVFGENTVQELVRKSGIITGVRWDLIGALQRNKVSKVVGRVALIHSVDSIRLADAICRAAVAAGTVQAVLVEVTLSGEPTKHGVAPDVLPRLLDELAPLEGLRVAGAMTMPPPGDPPAARRCFAALAALAQASSWPTGATELSMGMSGDFEIAIEEGATIVRLGSALFGPRGR